MENVRFSIIENDIKWNSDENDPGELFDQKSISSESNSDAECREELGHIFELHPNRHAIWSGDEIVQTLKQFPNSDVLLKMFDNGNFEELISGSEEVNFVLLMSVWNNRMDYVLSLLDNKLAQVNCTDSAGRTPLHFACCIGSVQLAKALLDRGADPNRWDDKKEATPLHCAASAGSVDCILLLLKRKAHINVGIEKRSALHFAIDKNAVDCVETLLKYGANPNTPQVFTETALHAACALGHAECVRMLLNAGADVRSQFGKRKLTALHLAAEDDYTECVQLLLDHRADVNARNADNQTPLHMACLSQCVETAELLIKYGADVNAVYREGRTSLHAAIVKQSRSLDCVKILLKAGASVNKADTYGYTPLHIAASNEFSNCVLALIENGADITARTSGGVSALSFIVRSTPDIIPKLMIKLDGSIKVNDHEIGDVDCEIKLDFRLLVPPEPSFDRGEMELLLAFIEVGQKRILTHPLCETFLFLKWRRIRKFFLLSLFFHSVYVLMFTLYVIGVYVRNCEETKPCQAPSYMSLIGYFVVLLNLILLGKEIFQMAHGITGYARYWENWLQWTILLGVFLCVTPESLTASNLFTVPLWQHHVAAIVIFMVWLELMMLVGRFPIFGLYVQMFTKVAANFAKFLLAYCCLLIAFALSFCVLFNDYKSFKSIPWSLLKAITMMSGELEFEDIFYGEDGIKYPVTSHILFLSFVLLVTVILTNLLVGLAVSDIQGLQVSAGLDRLIRQAELVSRLESFFYSRLLRRAPQKLLTLCKKSALLRTSRYQLQFITRPNDPRDMQLPEELKLNIYKLVAERRDKNRSMKRRRCESNYGYFQKKSFCDCQRKKTTRDDKNENLMRPRSATNVRNNLLTDDYQSISKIKSHLNAILKIQEDLGNVQRQIKLLSDSSAQNNELLLKRLNITTEELSRIKMLLDQRRPYF